MHKSTHQVTSKKIKGNFHDLIMGTENCLLGLWLTMTSGLLLPSRQQRFSAGHACATNRKRHKRQAVWKGHVKLSLFPDNMVAFVENLNNVVINLNLINLHRFQERSDYAEINGYLYTLTTNTWDHIKIQLQQHPKYAIVRNTFLKDV